MEKVLEYKCVSRNKILDPGPNAVGDWHVCSLITVPWSLQRGSGVLADGRIGAKCCELAALKSNGLGAAVFRVVAES